MEAVESQLGRTFIVIDGNKFQYKHILKRTNEECWLCRTELRCNSRLYTWGEGTVFSRLINQHSHPPNSSLLNSQRSEKSIHQVPNIDERTRSRMRFHRSVIAAGSVLLNTPKYRKKEMVEVCVGTSVGTITEPDCLGPCEPGTSVTLEGIVWHETEGVLVVNVTWRGKTYVGTLLDCTRHDWAPPRFCDSPTSDLDARTPKGRGKRGRGATSTNPTNDLSNFTETRSSVHSKLRSNNNGGVKGRRGPSSPTPFTPPKPEVTPNKRKPRAPEEETPSKKTKTPVPTTTASATTTVTSSTAATATTAASSTAPSTVTVTNAPICSPPASPVLFECPEPNCCKKYKNINGLKYHQSHAHGSADDEEAKESTSTSEAEEAPSPVSQTKKEDLAPSENLEPPSIDPAIVQPVVNSVETDQTASLPSPQMPVASLSVTDKSLVKPGVLRFAAQEEPILNVPTVPTVPSVVSRAASVTPPTTAQSPPQMQQSVTPQPPQLQPQQQPPMQTPLTAPLPHQLSQQHQTQPPQLPPQQQQQQPPMQQPPAAAAAAALLTQQAMVAQQQPVAQMQQTPTGLLVPTHQPPQHVMQPQAVSQASKVPQFKVKPASALMPDDKKSVKPVGHKKKMRKSPAGSPHPHPLDPPPLGIETGGREEVQSPAYSDISDDAAPLLESEVEVNKSKPTTGEKKVEVGPGQSPHYGMYPYYGQPPYLVPSVTDNKPKELSLENKTGTDKDKKEVGGPTNNDYQQKLLPQHYYPYGYVPGYPYNIDAGYPVAMMTTDDKGSKDEKSPGPMDGSKQSHNGNQPPIHIPNPNKIKTEPGVKDKHQNENHQIIKESIEIKNQMSPAYLYSRQHQQQQQHQQHQQAQQQAQQQQAQQQQQHIQAQQQQHQQQQEDLRRYYIYNNTEQRRKEQQQQQQHGGAPPEAPLKATPPPLQSKQNISAPSPKHKEKQVQEDKKEEKVKQEGVKPTMETQGPPPPPTSSYAYIHPGHMQSPYYGAIPFDPSGHAVYRGMNPMLVPSPYPNSPYLHPQLHAQIPRYHAPEDLSRPPAGAPKALDLLQHHANQYYSSHKIHELQERAMKSPTPKTVSASASPSAGGQQGGGGGGGGPQGGGSREQAVMQGAAGGGAPQGGPGGGGKQQQQQQQQSGGGEKECRSSSPPPQRHVHTHHHTHVGLGYPILAGNYPAPYGAAVLASQQAAAAAVVGAASVVAPYPPQSSPSATASSK